MYCTDCGSRNPKDSKFCRECGRKILTLEDEEKLSVPRGLKSINVDVPPEPPGDPDRLRQLLDMAFWHNEVGNVHGAILACEAALKVDPNSTSALSLLGCLYEKEGNDQKAVESFQRVVELNPDSVADYEKLEHLLRGIRSKAVTPSIAHLLVPPVLVHAARKYPKMPAVIAAVAAFVVACLGLAAIIKHSAPPGARSGEPVSMVSAINPAIRSTTDLYSTPVAPAPTPAPTYVPIYKQASNTTPAPNPDPFVTSSQTQDTHNVYAVIPPTPQQQQSAASMPSEQFIKPLSVSASDFPTPTHIVNVSSPPPVDSHVVMVNTSGSTSQSNPSSSGSDDTDISAAPPSHIYIKVHGGAPTNTADGATLLPNDTQARTISLRENAGASLQQKGLNLQEAGNYKAAEAAYESAIAAYQQDIDAGRGVDEAKRGIDACQVAVEICKQSQ